MKKAVVLSVVLLFLLGLQAERVSAASIALYDWAININGDVYDPSNPGVPGLNDSGFSWDTGLGALSITYSPGSAGNYFLMAFFDHEINEATNTFYNEHGAAAGLPPSGQSWEIDEPGYVFGDIYDHVTAPITNGFLDHSNGVPSGLEDDVSMALGWDFTLESTDVAKIRLVISESAPGSGFYLSHTDLGSNATIYLSGTLDKNPVPEPTTLLLLGSGLVGLFGIGRRKLTRKSR